MWPTFVNDAKLGGPRLLDKILDIQDDLLEYSDFTFGSPIWYLFDQSRRGLMNSKQKKSLGINTDLIFDAIQIKSFSRYNLWYIYWRIASYYRYINLNSIHPPFYESEHSIRSYIHKSWLAYYSSEVDSLASNSVFCKSIIHLVIDCESSDGICLPKNDLGQEAIHRSSNILKYRYGPDSWIFDGCEKSGSVYILRNRHFKDDVLKIGRTGREVNVRAKELSRATGVPSDFEVVHKVSVPDCYAVEQLVHELLSPKRTSIGKEFFSVSLPEALEAIQTAILRLGNTK